MQAGRPGPARSQTGTGAKTWKTHSVRASQLSTARQRADEPRRPARHSGADALLGRYRLGKRLGAGSFGTVWVARDEHLGRDVAVKVLPRERIMDARFEREAHAAARLAHPAIVTLYEAVADEESAYLVSELVRGATLGALLEGGRLSDRDIVAIGIALCDALAHAHGQGIVHRDVKPSNVLVPERPASAAYPAKLTDFGVARVIGGDSLTKTGDVVGTAAYMAPEQAAGRAAGAAADLYSLALVLYEALTGVNPLPGGAAGRAARLRAYLPPLRRQRRDLPRELGRAIDLALRPRAGERGTIEELRDALSSSFTELKDIPGVVEGPWRPRLTPAAGEPDPTSPLLEPDGRAQGRAQGSERAKPATNAWPARGLACACAALLGSWLGSRLLTQVAVAPAGLALVAGGAVLVLPRIGFLLLSAALAIAAVIHGHAGEALLVAVALSLPVVLLPRAGTSWPLPAAAPLLGVLGLGGAWPALAARAPTVWRRAALGFIGWVWLVAVEVLSGSRIYVKLPPEIPARGAWGPSIFEAADHVLGALLSSGMLAGGLIWALAATVLPTLLAGRSLALDAIKVALWAVALVTATGLALSGSAGGLSLISTSTAALGGFAAALVALAPAMLTARRANESPGPGLP